MEDRRMETGGLIRTAVESYRAVYEQQQVTRAQLDGIDMTDVADAVEQAWQCEGTAREAEAARLLQRAIESATARWSARRDPDALLRGIDEEFDNPPEDEASAAAGMLRAESVPLLRVIEGGVR